MLENQFIPVEELVVGFVVSQTPTEWGYRIHKPISPPK